MASRSKPCRPMSDLGVAIFGAGRAGHGHARAIAQTPGTRLTAVFDTDRQRAEAFAETHGCLAFTDSDSVLRRDDVHLVMVALPNFLHEHATIEAATAGKHIFLEKPIAGTNEESNRLSPALPHAPIPPLGA